MAEQDFERLLGIVNQLRIELDLTNQSIATFQKRFSQTGSQEFNRALSQQKVLAEQLTKQLNAAQQAYSNLSASSKTAYTNIPHPPGSTPPGSGRVDESNLRGGRSIDEFAITSKKASEEQALLNSLRFRVEAEKKYSQALDQATKLEFGINDLKRVQTRGTSGIEQLQFQKYDEGGTLKRFDTFVNPQGRATPGISNQFRSFGQGVVRDIGELTKWSLALAAVYGPVQKLQELTQIMIENQTKLAEATITVNSSFLDQSRIFDTAANAADAAGESIGGVIDAFTQAYRATGGGTDNVQRYADAQTLLSDSLTLSKLSTLDQAQAIDTLSAALRQSGLGLSEGTELLDKWVRVTKIANVDMTTLATGFAVVGDAAEAAGIDADKLNGIIAAIAETGISTGKETANIARSIVSGFQSDQAKKELENLGVAVEDVTTGQMRPFLDIMKQVYDLRKNKIIDDTQFSRLTLALGGGTRRQAAYSSFIENFDRVSAVADESSKASGEAQAALAKQLETVQTSLTKLGNAFQVLAQTMGTKGGFLGIITSSVNGLTGLVKIFDVLTGSLGKATPALVAFIAASAVLKSQGRGGIQNVVSGIGAGLQTPEYESRLIAAGQGRSGSASLPFGTQAKNFIGNNILGNNIWSGASQGILVSLLPALSNIFNKEDRFGKLKGGADIVGGVAGGIIGSLTGAGPVIGAAIGTAISEAFVNSTIARKTDLFGYGSASKVGTSFAAGTDTDAEAALKQAEINLYKSIGGGDEASGRLATSGQAKIGESIVNRINDAIKNGDKEALEKALVVGPRGTKLNEQQLQGLGLSTNLINQAFTEKKPIEYSPERAAYLRASEEARTEYDKALSEYKSKNAKPEDATTAFGQQVSKNQTAYQSILDGIQAASKKTLNQQRLAGDIKGSEFARRTEAVGGFDTKALQYYTALGDSFKDVNGNINSATDAFEAFNKIIVSGSADSVPEITSIVNEIQTLINLLDDPKLNKEALGGYGGEAAARDKLKELQQLGGSLLNDVYNQAVISNLKVPDVQGDINRPLSSSEFQTVKSQAVQMQQDFYKGYLNFSDSEYDGLTQTFDAWAQIIKDSGEAFYQTVEGIDPQFFQQAMQKLIEEGKLLSQQTTFGIQQLDITSQQGAGLQGSIDYYSKYLSQNFPQYQQKPEEFGVIFSDYVTDVLHGDNLAVKLALEKLVDLNQKQLDGMYNIPEGATFWVPLTAAYYKPKNEGGGVGAALDSAAVTSNTSATDQNTNALNTLRDAITAKKEEQVEKVYGGLRGESKDQPQRNPQAQRAYEREMAVQDRDKNLSLANSYAERGRGYGQPESGTSFLETLQQSLASWLRGWAANSFTGQGLGSASTPAQSARPATVGSMGSVGSRDMTNAAPTVNAKLDFRIDNTTQLVVDGRILASVITPYLAADLLRLEASQGTITKRYVV